MQGKTIDGKYEVLRLLGQGGMGAVYEARHLGTGRRVAVKLIVAEALLRGGDIVARFQREARASGAIDSQHVVQVLDTGLDPATQSPYMVMEFLSGEDL
ncbi:MAG: protein kinase, partial [Polyangiaceae bacterium]